MASSAEGATTSASHSLEPSEKLPIEAEGTLKASPGLEAMVASRAAGGSCSASQKIAQHRARRKGSMHEILCVLNCYDGAYLAFRESRAVG